LPEKERGIAPVLKRIQEKTAFLPDYGFRPATDKSNQGKMPPAWPGKETGASTAGIIGAAIVLGAIVLIGWGIKVFRRRRD
jgi:cobalt/nickel transport system permease protein